MSAQQSTTGAAPRRSRRPPAGPGSRPSAAPVCRRGRRACPFIRYNSNPPARNPPPADNFSLTVVAFVRVIGMMFRTLVRWLFRIVLLLIVGLVIFVVNLVWFRPWSLNLFYEKVFAVTVFERPELLSSLGIVERFGIRGQ